MKRMALVVVMMFVGLAMTASGGVIPLDISGGYNYDGYISIAEQQEAVAYDPCADWGLGSRQVSAVFGHHSLSSGARSYIWQGQDGSHPSDGLPTDGKITTSYGLFQLSTALDAEPGGGWGNPEIPKPTTPTGLLARSPNVIRAYRPHSGSTGAPTASVTALMPPAQQGNYTDINFLVAGDNKKCMIYAIYADGEVEIYQSPGTPKLDELGFPTILNSSSSNPDILEVASALTDHTWGVSGNYSGIRGDDGHVWTLANPLPLDDTRVLTGIRLAIYDGDTWKSRQAFILAASADEVIPPPIPEPAGLGLVGLALLALKRRRS